MFESAKPFAMLTAAEAVAEANAYITATLQIERHIRDVTPTGIVDAVRDALARPVGPEQAAATEQLSRQLPAEMFQRLVLTISTAEAARRWKQHRVVYRINRELAESLVESESNTPIPREVFSRLPHPNPFVAFPAPVALPAPNAPYAVAKPTELTGMLVTGVDHRSLPCDTSSADLQALRVSLSARVEYAETEQAAGYEELTVQIPVAGLGADKVSIDDMVQAQVSNFYGQYDHEHVRVGFTLAVGLLLYVCSDQNDIRKSINARPRGKSAAARGVATAKTVMDIGFDIGPRLAAARRVQNAPRPATGAVSGSSPRAHLRRAHWHTYLTGPMTGPRTPIVKWISPIAVNAEQRDPDRTQVIRA